MKKLKVKNSDGFFETKVRMSQKMQILKTAFDLNTCQLLNSKLKLYFCKTIDILLLKNGPPGTVIYELGRHLS